MIRVAARARSSAGPLEFIKAMLRLLLLLLVGELGHVEGRLLRLLPGGIVRVRAGTGLSDAHRLLAGAAFLDFGASPGPLR